MLTSGTHQKSTSRGQPFWLSYLYFLSTRSQFNQFGLVFVFGPISAWYLLHRSDTGTNDSFVSCLSPEVCETCWKSTSKTQLRNRRALPFQYLTSKDLVNQDEKMIMVILACLDFISHNQSTSISGESRRPYLPKKCFRWLLSLVQEF